MRKFSFLFSIFLLLLPSAAKAQRIQFRDITAQAGIHFVHNNAAFGKKYLPETMGPGCAFIDYDNDGWPDISADQRPELARASGASLDPEALSQQPRRHVHRRHGEGRTGRFHVRDGRCGGRLR